MSTEDLKRVVRQHIDLTWNKGRLALAEQLQSKDFLYKSSFLGQTLDSAGYAGMVQEIREAMPDLEVVVEECIAEGHKVFTWSTLIGSIQKPALGYPPSDRVLSISAMAFWTFNSLGRCRSCAPCSTWKASAPSWGWPAAPTRKKRCPEAMDTAGSTSRRYRWSGQPPLACL